MLPVASSLLTNLTLVDLDADTIHPDASIHVEDGLIAQILVGDAPEASAERLDLGGAYVIPGLWDVHSHLSHERPRYIPGETLPARVMRCLWAAVKAVKAGITGIRRGRVPLHRRGH